jgi:putative transposase
MTALESVTPAGLVREHLESASADLLRAMVQTFAEALMSAERWSIFAAGRPARSGRARATGSRLTPSPDLKITGH